VTWRAFTTPVDCVDVAVRVGKGEDEESVVGRGEGDGLMVSVGAMGVKETVGVKDKERVEVEEGVTEFVELPEPVEELEGKFEIVYVFVGCESEE